MKKFREESVKIFLALMFTFFPLYYTDNYYNILHDKRNIFILIGLLLTAVILISLFIGMGIDISKKNLLIKIKQEMKSIRPLDVIVTAFAAAALLSACHSEHMEEAFWGSIAWDVGCGVILLGTVVYFIISRWFSGRADIWMYVYLGSLAVVLIGAIDRLGYDFLVMHDEIPLQYEIFISTIGNVSFWAAYLSMLVPFFMLAPLFTKSRIKRGGIYLFLLVSYFTLYTTLTNTSYMGIGIGALFVVYFSLRDVKRIRNLAVNALLFMAAGMAADIFWKYEFTPRKVDTDTISRLLLEYKLYFAVGAAGLLLLGLCFMYEEMKEENKKKLDFLVEKVFSKIWLGMIAALAIGIIYYMVHHYSMEMVHYRGSIWYFSFEGFLDGSIWEKILGVGPGLLDYVTRAQIENAPFHVVWDYYYNTAHCDVLEYLVTMGVVGAVLRVLMYLLPFLMLRKGEAYKTERAALLAALTGYIGQGLITGPYILSYAIYMVLLGVYAGYCRKSVEINFSAMRLD